MADTTFDWSECLRMSANKEELANQFLSLFEEELPIFQEKIKQAKQSHDIEQLQYHIHKLHGACCYAGVPKLKALAEQLETQIQSKQMDQLNVLLDKADQEISLVLQELKQRK